MKYRFRNIILDVVSFKEPMEVILNSGFYFKVEYRDWFTILLTRYENRLSTLNSLF